MSIALRRYQSGVAAMSVALALTGSMAAADEADAKRLLRAMSDYMTAAQTIAFDFNSTLEVVTPEGQKLGIATSGTTVLARPDRLRATRTGGFADIELIYDGKSATLLGKNAGVYATKPASGSVEAFIEMLRLEHGVILPAADLLAEAPYDLLMADVTDVKDLGSGVIDGRECDHLAFRTPTVDWQIWIAQGDAPFPCRYEITTASEAQGPQFRIDIREWTTGVTLAEDAFAFTAPSGASEITFGTVQDKFGDLPDHFEMKAAK